nr:MAG TPA: L SHAPED TAIL FIBER PROTEIN [Caudoviricetes sp.]
MAGETNARIEFSVASVEEWEKVNPKLHQGEPVFAKKPSGKYILKVGAPGGSTYKNAVVVWDQDDAETKMTSAQEAAAQALASKNAASASASAAKSSENAAATSKSAAATSEANAKTSETNAATSKTAAANSASTASTKATAAGNSASAAATSEKNAASSASAAATSESNALKSASAASTSAGNAKSSETKASASASAAKASENAAATSKSAAATSEANAKTSETNAGNSAELSKKWAMSDTSPDGVTGNKSSKTWAGEAKTSASNSAASASASQSSASAASASATQSANSASASKSSANASASSASAASSSASAASTSAGNAKTSETNAAKSATAAAQSAKEAATFDPSYYLASKDSIGETPESNPQIISIPCEKGMFPIQGYPDKLSSTTGKSPYSIVTNFMGKGGALFSLYAQHTRRELYFRTGWPDERGWGSWVELATEENMAALDAKIPTKTSQLTNDSGFAVISNGHLVINGSELWIE